MVKGTSFARGQNTPHPKAGLFFKVRGDVQSVLVSRLDLGLLRVQVTFTPPKQVEEVFLNLPTPGTQGVGLSPHSNALFMVITPPVTMDLRSPA